jgi:hypothetical protein
VFEFLFNVKWHDLLGAQLQFAWPLWALLIALLGALCGALLCSGYFMTRQHIRLSLLRAGIALIVVLIVARPQLLLPRPGSSVGAVAVLVDASASMSIEDSARGMSRTRAARAAIDANAGALEARFDVRYMRFDGRLHEERETDRGVTKGQATNAENRAPAQARAAAVNAQQAVSDPLGALIDAVALGDVSAVVLLSDGGQVSGVNEGELLDRLRASAVAVHVLGVGDPQLTPDVNLRSVSVPPRVLNEDEVDVRVEMSASGFAGQTVKLTVRDNGVLAGESFVAVDAAHFRRSVTIPIQVHESGFRHIEVRLQAPPADRVAANNRMSTLLNVRSQAVKVLHFEGEPRFEVKFVRRALANDSAVSLSSLVRTGDNRYLRLGISAKDELVDGFPTTAKELFRYQVLVIGSVNVATFTQPQLDLLQRFVSVRGGSVLFLGGSNSFAEGDWQASTIAPMLPVLLEPAGAPFKVAVRAMVTGAGRVHAVTKGLFDGTAKTQAITLPELAMVNDIRRIKRGASVLLQGDDGGAAPLVMLAWQRFGAGRVAVMPVRDTWRWRMHADVPVHDQSHELFWRRLLRWLARDVPSQSSARVIPNRAAPGQVVRLHATLRDDRWHARNDTSVMVRITTPLGDIVERALSADALHAARERELGYAGGADLGVYNARYSADDTGTYEVHVADGQDLQQVASQLPATDTAAGLLISASGDEFIAPALHQERLRRIASATGGSYRHVSQTGDLTRRIASSVPLVPSWSRVDLWNAPILLLSLLLLACSEWWLRRQRRQLP